MSDDTQSAEPVDSAQTVEEAVGQPAQENPDRASLFYPQPQEPEPDDVAEEPAEVETQAVETEDTENLPEQPTVDQPEDAEAEGAGEPIRSFSELVESQEWDPEWADSLTVIQKIDGEEREVTIGELRNVHQTLEAATKRLDEAKTRSKAILEEADQAKAQQAEKLAEAAALTLMVEETLGLKDADQRLEQIRREQGDTAYLVEKDKIEALRKQVGQLKAYAAESMQAVLNQANGQMTEEERNELAQEEHAKLLERVPAWKENPEQAQKDAVDMVEYLKSEYAYEDDQINSTLDHRLWDMARKAMLYDRHQKAAGATKKEVKKIPVVRMRPSSKAEETPKPKPRDRVSTLYGKS